MIFVTFAKVFFVDIFASAVLVSDGMLKFQPILSAFFHMPKCQKETTREGCFHRVSLLLLVAVRRQVGQKQRGHYGANRSKKSESGWKKKVVGKREMGRQNVSCDLGGGEENVL